MISPIKTGSSLPKQSTQQKHWSTCKMSPKKRYLLAESSKPNHGNEHYNRDFEMKINASHRSSRHSAENAENRNQELLMQKCNPPSQITVRMTTTVSSSQTVQWCEEQSQEGHLLLELIELLLLKLLTLQI